MAQQQTDSLNTVLMRGELQGTCDCCQTMVGRPWGMKAQRVGGYLYTGWIIKESTHMYDLGPKHA